MGETDILQTEALILVRNITWLQKQMHRKHTSEWHLQEDLHLPLHLTMNCSEDP